MKTITLHPETPVKDIRDLFGIFFEDINHAADGGLYGELIRNRSFEFDPIDHPSYHALTAWYLTDGLSGEIRTEEPIHPNNPHYLHLTAAREGCLENEGYDQGICLEEGASYEFSMYVKGQGILHVMLSEAPNTTMAPADFLTASGGVRHPISDGREFSVSSSAWQKVTHTFKVTKTTHTACLQIIVTAGSDLDVDMISLFPADTFNGRENGLRKDIATALKDLHPKFMRFPGGCLVHDGSLNANDRNSMYRWKNTLGPLEQRPSRRNNWGYNQSLGLGYYEYFCFCEDIGCTPLPVVPGGFNPHKGEGVPMEELDAWIRETLDLIEFANGSAETPMGSLRAKLGHPESFHLRYIGVGNEEIGAGFFERYPRFHEAIRKAYPDIKIINSAGPFAVGDGYDAGWKSAVQNGSDLVDEHYYSSPEWFLAKMHHYDDYDPNGPKVFLGEYASWGNTFYNALTEAAYMTHLEKAPAVALACYAPLLCNTAYRNWTPDLLFFNGHQVVKTANYYVQQLFMHHQGETEIALETEDLEEILHLSDTNRIAGDITIAGNDIEGICSDMVLELPQGAKNLPSLTVRTDNETYVLAEDVDAEEYALEFSFKRNAGRKGLKICFGKKKGEDTCLIWDFGGWDNWDCNIASNVRGRGSVISHRIYHVTDEPYKLRLEVKGRRIKAYVNGVLMNDTVDRLPEIEELYVSASKDSEGNVFLKAVNLTGDDKEVRVRIPGLGGRSCSESASSDSSTADSREALAYGKILQAPLSAENTFEEEVVAPRDFTVPFEQDGFTYAFPAHSVTVFRI
ncbi:MAG: hypothetical protein K6A92_07895 [Lachnospiraceae bacterium]|nr:hypothetical protein [Lachnospiraceae bacterium]